ncbi:MAG: hypothetical protein L6V93_00945 [Clostridiales bacterium]|nr:MAG: hypothetical protein L6V93_00945 [Clostridiales bacterium]
MPEIIPIIKSKDKIDITSEEVFDELESTYKREHFIIELLSHDMKFFRGFELFEIFGRRNRIYYNA